MAPQQNDYTGVDTTLVPGTLTVFRHFLADLRSGVLTPMNYNPTWSARSGAPPIPGHRPYSRPIVNLPAMPWDSKPRTPEKASYQAECSKAYRVSAVKIYDGHSAPAITCTCGFYASYDPETDFYPGARWGREYTSLIGSPEYEDFAIVRAAVAVSGKVVMGRLGVRAEKMTILGLTVDWDKQVREREAQRMAWDRDPYFGGTRRRYVVYDHTIGDYVMNEVEVKSEDDTEIIAKAHRLANYYGATFHGSVAGLVETYPKADVSALGIDEAPPELEPDSWGAFQRQLTAQQTLYAAKAMQQATRQAATSFDEIRKALADVLGLDVDVKPKPPKRPRPGGTMPDHARRALEAKQNRKAPPGTGIDRRRRKL